MTGFAVYSSEYNPQRLHSQGDTATIDTTLIEDIVRAGDRPLDLYVDLGQRQLLWSFKAERQTKSARTGYFIAAYQGADEDFFRDFEKKLRSLHDSAEWAIPHTGDLRWDIGFELWRIPAEAPGLSNDQLQELIKRLEAGNLDSPIEFGMRTHRSALQVVRTLDEAGVPCTVAIGGSEDVATLSGVDLILQPGGESDFQPLSSPATEIENKESDEIISEPIAAPNQSSGADQSGTLLSGISMAVLFVFLSFAVYSFIQPSPVQPITGLATFGGFFGSLSAILAGAWVLEDEYTTWGLDWAQDTLFTNVDRSTIILAYGTLLGFGFPRIMWELGVALGSNGFLFGTITNFGSSALTVGVYVITALVIGLAVVLFRYYWTGAERLSTDTLLALVASHTVYALSLTLATGLAGSIWFYLIPSATV